MSSVRAAEVDVPSPLRDEMRPAIDAPALRRSGSVGDFLRLASAELQSDNVGSAEEAHARSIVSSFALARGTLSNVEETCDGDRETARQSFSIHLAAASDAKQRACEAVAQYCKISVKDEGLSSVEVMLGVFSRLRDEESFEDWIAYGIPTTVGGMVDSPSCSKGDEKAAMENANESEGVFIETLLKGAKNFCVNDEAVIQLFDGCSWENLRAGAFMERVCQVQALLKHLRWRLDGAAEPHSFESFVTRCGEVREALSGETHLSSCLVLADEAEELLKRGHELSAPSFACSALCARVVRDINSLVAANEAEWEAREAAVAECMMLQECVNSFVRDCLALQRQLREVRDVVAARESTEKAIDAVITPIEALLGVFCSQVDFTSQRRTVVHHQERIGELVRIAVQLLHRLDGEVNVLIPVHQCWKRQLLDRGFARLHAASELWMCLTMGFIDPVLKVRVRAQDRNSALKGIKREYWNYEIVSFMVKYDRSPMAEVARVIKGVPSSLVGRQLAMGSRSLLKEVDSSFDVVWGFGM